MKIRMLEHRTGPRHDGRDWPGYGGEIDVDNEEGRALCAQGSAIPVPEERKAETPEAKRAASEEKRTERKAARSAPTP